MSEASSTSTNGNMDDNDYGTGSQLLFDDYDIQPGQE